MTFEIGLIFAILAVAILLFITEWIRPDVVAILVLVSLAVAGLLPTEEVLSGFSSEAVIAIAGLLILSAGLVRSGVVRWAAGQMDRIAGKGQKRLTITSTTLPGILSGIVSDIATVSLFIPVVIRLARRNNIAHSRLLLPVAMAALAGGNLTIIGASHNLVVNSLVQERGETAFGFFELAPIGLALIIAFALYALLLGRRLLPEREQEAADDGRSSTQELMKTYDLNDRLWEVSVNLEDSEETTTVDSMGVGLHYGLTLIALLRDDETCLILEQDQALESGDILLVLGRKERVEEMVNAQPGLTLLGHPETQEEFPTSGAELIEVVVPPRSRAGGKSLSDCNFRSETGLTGIALWRSGHPVRTDVGKTLLEDGDAILLYGPKPKTKSFSPEPNFVWLNKPQKEEAPQELRHLGPWAALILLAVVLSAAFDLLAIGVAALGGAAAMVLLGILSPRQAYESVEWRTIALVGGMYPLGLALENSGAAERISNLMADTLGAIGPLAVLAGLLIISLILTQSIHGAAVAVIMTPVALDTAAIMDINARALAVAVIVGASATYLLPVGHPAPLLVQRPGAYKQRDYLKYGAGLALLTILISVVLIPIVWPL
jgi:di/tricarboxylate transporter